MSKFSQNESQKIVVFRDEAKVVKREFKMFIFLRSLQSKKKLFKASLRQFTFGGVHEVFRTLYFDITQGYSTFY